MFNIDQEIIDDTTNCQHSFKCLNGDFSHYGGIEQKGEDLLCKSRFFGFCFYKIEFDASRTICGCYTRREIFRKYSV